MTTLSARLLEHAAIHDDERRRYGDQHQAQWTADLREAAELLAPVVQAEPLLKPLSAWSAYGVKSGLLDSTGVAVDRLRAQTAFHAFAAGWNAYAMARAALAAPPVPALAAPDDPVLWIVRHRNDTPNSYPAVHYTVESAQTHAAQFGSGMAFVVALVEAAAPAMAAPKWADVVRQCITDPAVADRILSIPDDASADEARKILTAPYPGKPKMLTRLTAAEPAAPASVAGLVGVDGRYETMLMRENGAPSGVVISHPAAPDHRADAPAKVKPAAGPVGWPPVRSWNSCKHLDTDMNQYPCDNCYCADKWEAPAPQPEAPTAPQQASIPGAGIDASAGRVDSSDVAPMCQCGDRPAAECTEQWGPKCDLGNNAAHVGAVQPVPAVHHTTDPETQYADQPQHLNCPACGGSGHVDDIKTKAVRDVLAERRRQVEVEGWTPEHDDKHSSGGMAVAAACYTLNGTSPTRFGPQRVSLEHLWRWAGWGVAWFKPKNRRRDLIRAAALLLAEIERLDRAAHLATGDAK